MSEKLLVLDNIFKHFSAVKALDGVSLSINKSEVLALVGENGAGKSTLMKIIAGIHKPDTGKIFYKGIQKEFCSPKESLDSGIALIHQELNLCDNLNIAENIFLGREPTRFGIVHRQEMLRLARLYLKRIGLRKAPDTSVAKLSIAEKQLVEIARALSFEAQVLIMDEPTSSLTDKEASKLFAVINELRNKGIALIYISHRIPEILALADRAVILRDGKRVANLERSEMTRDNLIELMAGKAISQHSHSKGNTGQEKIRIKNFKTQVFPEVDVSFAIHSGEILGFGGLVGSGRTELLESIFAIRKKIAGEVYKDGNRLNINNPADAIAAKIALVPEDRKAHGLILDLPIKSNILLSKLLSLSRCGIRLFRSEKIIAESQQKILGIKCNSLSNSVCKLSGGNQQKVVLAKCLALQPQVLLLDEPTRGVDVSSKEEIYSLLKGLAGQGMAICLVSSDSEELLRICDRVLVMNEGEIKGELLNEEASENEILSLAHKEVVN